MMKFELKFANGEIFTIFIGDPVAACFERFGGNLTNIINAIFTTDSAYDLSLQELRELITTKLIDYVIDRTPYNYRLFLWDYYENISEESWIKAIKHSLTAYDDIKNPSETLKDLYKTLTL